MNDENIRKDISVVLRGILLNSKNITNADAGTIYLVDNGQLCFEYILNDTLGIDFNNQKETMIEEINTWKCIEISEENRNMVIISSILDDCLKNIDDLQRSNYNNFEGTEKFDKKTGYSSITSLAIPIKLDDSTLIGALQLFNKIENNKIVKFPKEDESNIELLASQASSYIDNAKKF